MLAVCGCRVISKRFNVYAHAHVRVSRDSISDRRDVSVHVLGASVAAH